MPNPVSTLNKLDIVALEARNSLDFLEQVFSMYEHGTVFAICRPEIDLENYPVLHVTKHVTTSARHGWMQTSYAAASPDETPAQVVFSSGTEGHPKALLISAAALADVEVRLLEIMRITPDIREYIGVPVTYSFGLGRARVIARAGGSFYLPERFDIAEIREMLASDQINAISAVPSLWRLLLAQPSFLGELGAKVRWIEIGSQYMSAEEKRGLCRIFPNARIVQHYGLTEASRSTFLIVSQAPAAHLESVGRPIGQTDIRIGTEGEICIRGQHLALGVLGDDGEIAPVVAADGWLHTRDQGYMKEGWLYYGGRLDNQINLSGMKLAGETLERRLAELVTLNQAHFAITSVADELRGETLLLALDSQAAPHARLLEAGLEQVLIERGIAGRGTIRLLPLETLPRTGSGKVRHRELRALWEAEHAAQNPIGSSDLAPDEEAIANVWRSVLGPVSLTPESNFYDVGGDSLGVMHLGLVMEARFPRSVVQATMAGRSLREVAAFLQSETRTPEASTSQEHLPPRAIQSWGLNIARGIMVISVLLSHWAPGIWERLAPHVMQDPLSFAYRMGTPGFAIVFGIGVGYFMLDGYPSNAHSVSKRSRFSLLLILSAFLLLVSMRTIDAVLSGAEMTGREWGEAFYNVLAFYILAILSLPVWLRLLHRAPERTLALGIPALWGLWLLSRQAFGAEQWESPLEWLRLMMVAKYSYFRIFPLVLAGIFIGIRMVREPDTRQFARHACLWGVVIIGLALTGGAEREGLGFLLHREAELWHVTWGSLLYFGIVCLTLGLALLSLHGWERRGYMPRIMLKGLILMGGLALPIYAFHQLAIPAKDILLLAGLNGSLAIALPMAVFLILIGYGMRRLHAMFF